jgi:two-component system, response regulator YesN
MNYYRRILRTFSTIAIAYTLTAATFFFAINYNALKKNFERNSLLTAQQLAKYTDQNIEAVEELDLMLKVNDSLKSYVGETLPSLYHRTRLHIFLNQISSLVSTNSRVKALSKFTDDFVTMDGSTGNVLHYLELTGMSEESFENILTYFEENRNDGIRFVKTKASNVDGITVVRFGWLGMPQPLYTSITYDVDKFINTTGLINGTFVVLYEDNILCSQGNLASNEVHNVLSGKKTGQYPEKFYISSKYENIKYVYLSKPEYDMFWILLYTVAGGILLLILGVSVMTLLSKNMYSPIKGVLNSLPETFIKDSPIDDEFDYIKETVAKLNADRESLRMSINKYKISQKSEFIRDLLHGLVPHQEIDNLSKQCGLDKGEAPYIAVIVEYANYSEVENVFSQEAIFALNNHIKDTLQKAFSHQVFFEIFDMNLSTYAIIASGLNPENLESYLRKSILELESGMDIELRGIIGFPSANLQSIHHSYRSINEIRAKLAFSPFYEKVINVSTFKINDQVSIYYPLEMEQALINSVITGKELTVESIVEEIYKTNFIKNKISQEQYIQFCNMFLTTMNRILDGLHKTTRDVFGQETSLYFELRSCESPEVFRENAIGMLRVLSKSAVEEKNRLSNDLCDEMLSYIHKNYQKDIDLYNLAEHFNLSRGYVSYLFKNLTGQNFKDYLNKYRFEMACDMLDKDSTLKIKDIATAVGCNSNTLFRLFTKYLGVSPSQYTEKKK